MFIKKFRTEKLWDETDSSGFPELKQHSSKYV